MLNIPFVIYIDGHIMSAKTGKDADIRINPDNKILFVKFFIIIFYCKDYLLYIII